MNHDVTYQTIIDRFKEWAQKKSDIRLVMVIGSRARMEQPADEWSDLDLVFVTAQPDTYLSTVDWLHYIGTYHLTFLEPTPVENFTERRVLFDGGLDVDFIPLPLEAIRNGLPPEAAGVFRRGFKIILDKDGFVQSLPHVSFEPVRVQPPNQTEYLQLVNDFLYHTVWTAKKLRRGELWAAKLCCDGDMKWKLLKMIEWHSQLVIRQSLDTWHNGRFLDKWADPRVLEQLKHAFAHYDPYDVWQALLATKELFRWLAVEVAQQLDYTYPEAADLYVTNLLKTYQNTP